MIGYAYKFNKPPVTCSRELLRKVLDLPEVAGTCAEIKDALEAVRRGEISPEEFKKRKKALKDTLPVLLPHATFRGGKRDAAHAVPSGLSMFDIDHLPHPRHFWAENVEPIARELGIVLAHVTPSTEGLRLVFRIPQGMNLEEAQRWMADMLDLKDYDACVKDLARCSFLVPRSYVLLLDEEGLLEGKGDNKEFKEFKDLKDLNPTPPENPTFRGVPYSDIIRCWFELQGGEPVEGQRNDLLFKLACELRYITDNNAGLMLRVMPRYGVDEDEIRQIISSSLKESYRRTRHPLIDQAVEKALGRPAVAALEEVSKPPEMPKKLPRLIALLLSRTPDIYKPAVAHAVFPALATHLWQTRFRYIDNVEHEATLMNVLMAGTGAGKSCIDEPIRRIMADIRERDKQNLAREREWKNEVNSKGANKDKRRRPEGLVVQIISPDMTNPAFVMRTKEADGHFLYTRMNEIDMFDALRGSGRGGQQFQIMCLAFDPGNTYGQTRVGTQSVTEEVTIRFNWNASTTIGKGQQYFRNVLTDGPISRLNFCTIPERPIGSPMPVYGTYDKAFDAQLKPYIEHLTRAGGTVECREAYELARRLADECADRAQLSQDRVYENLSFRANVIAYLKACVLYVANGRKWEPEMEDFVRWSLEYDLWCKMEFFGAAIEAAEHQTARTTARGPRNLLTLLPEEFTLEDARKMRRSIGKSERGTVDMVDHWLRRGHIRQTGEERYRKATKSDR